MRIGLLLPRRAPVRFARLLWVFVACAVFCVSNSRAGDVSGYVEVLGNPYLARYTTAVNNRMVNRMRTFNNRVYLGNGSTGAQAPADVWYFDLAQDRFVKEGFLPEETVEQMRVFGDRMYIPGRDSMGQGNLYRWDTTNGWQTLRIGSDGHYMDMYERAGKLFVHSAILSLPYPRISISANQGTSFTTPGQLIDGVNFNSFSGSHWQFFEFKGVLYSTISRSTAPDLNYPPTPTYPPFMVKYTGVDTAPIARVHQHYTDFCPPNEFWVVTDFVEFGAPGSEIGVFNGGGNLYRVSDVEAATPATRIELPFQGPADGAIGAGIVTILKADGALYTASNVSSNGAWQIAVCKSTDGINWDQEFHFNSANRVRSFERTPGGDFLFSVRASNSPEMGNIVRVRAEAIAGAALPLVNVSADETTVWEGSGNGLTLRIRRAGATASPLDVNYTVGGTAVADVDYAALSGTATIPAGAHSVEVPIAVIPTPGDTGARTLTVTLAADAGYAIAAPSEATFTITDETANGTGLPKPGLALWLRADLGVTLTSGLVSQWADQSGNGFLAKQATSTRRPTPVASGVGGQPALRFDAGDSLDIGSIKSQIYYAAIVFTNRVAVTTASAQTLLNFMAYAEGGATGVELGSAQTQYADETVSIYQQAWRAGTLTAGAHKLVLAQPAHAAAYGLTIDGLNRGMTPQNTNKNVTLTGDAFRIGSRTGSSRYFDGTISEIIIYDRPLSAAEQAAVDAYLAERYFVPNQPPSAAPDTITRATGQPISAGAATLLANDADVNGNALTVVGVANALPSGAAVSLSDGVITYTPPAGPDAIGSFTYTVDDGNGGTSVAAVTVKFNRPPVANPDTYTRTGGSDLLVAKTSLMANDTDPDGDARTFISAAASPGSTATVTIENTNVRFHAVVGNNATDTFTYVIQDSFGFQATGTVTVNASNRRPTASSNSYSMTGGTTLNLTHAQLLANDYDADKDPFSLTSVLTPSTQGGDVVWAPTTVAFTPAPGFFGSDVFKYIITDIRGLSSTGSVTVAVNGPPVANPDTVYRTANTSITIAHSTLLANDTDPENGTKTISASSAYSALGARISRGTSTITYYAIAGVNGDDTFSYTLRDNKGATSVTTVTVTTAAPAPGMALPAAVVPELAAGELQDGTFMIRVVAEPNATLQVFSAPSAEGPWALHRDLTASEAGVAYFEASVAGDSKFFRAQAVGQNQE